MMRVVKLENGTIGKVVIGQYEENENVEIFVPVGYDRYSEEKLIPLQDLKYSEGTQEDYITYLEKDFPWGEVIKTHVIGEYQIIQYIDSDNEETFQGYINFKDTRESFHSLEEAITGAICYKYDGANSQANTFLWKMIR